MREIVEKRGGRAVPTKYRVGEVFFKYEIIIVEHPSHPWQYIAPLETINQSISLHEGGAFR